MNLASTWSCALSLGRAYNLKALADYETGPGVRVSVATARAAIETARRFVESVAALI
jgi:hypothetical protein